jgi:uncharacterized membrane protein
MDSEDHNFYISSWRCQRMARFAMVVSIVILIAALFLLFNKLFTPQPIQITLQSGQEVTTSTSEYFGLAEVLLMVICAFLIGAASLYLFFNSDRPTILAKPRAAKPEDLYINVLPLLKHQEKEVIIALRDAGGEMQQNTLILKLGLSKVKMTRVLHSLTTKNLIVKERHGLTNMVRLRK